MYIQAIRIIIHWSKCDIYHPFIDVRVEQKQEEDVTKLKCPLTPNEILRPLPFKLL